MLVKVSMVCFFFFKSVKNVQGRRKGVARESHKTGLAERTGYAGKQMKISLVRWSLGRPKCTLEIKTEFRDEICTRWEPTGFGGRDVHLWASSVNFLPVKFRKVKQTLPSVHSELSSMVILWEHPWAWPQGTHTNKTYCQVRVVFAELETTNRHFSRHIKIQNRDMKKFSKPLT